MSNNTHYLRQDVSPLRSRRVRTVRDERRHNVTNGTRDREEIIRGSRRGNARRLRELSTDDRDKSTPPEGQFAERGNRRRYRGIRVTTARIHACEGK